MLRLSGNRPFTLRGLRIRRIAFVGLCGAAGIAYKLSHRTSYHTLPTVTVTTTIPANAGPNPAQTVRQYFAAINHRKYLDAWRLRGGAATQSYARFRAGFAGTLHDTITIVSVNGDIVTAKLAAEQVSGQIRTFQGTYTVTNGIITATDVQRTS